MKVLRENTSTWSKSTAKPRVDRRGSLLVWGAFLLIVLIGMVGLVIDTGLMLAGFRHAQNAADAAALAAAHERLRGASPGVASSVGSTFVTDAAHNNLVGATPTINIPPSSGPYAGNSNYAEALVTSPNQTFFIHVLPGVSAGNTVNSRAVAGYELVQIAAGVIALNPNAKPGLKVSGQATLVVDGAVIVNSEGGGVDENGDPSIFGSGQNGTTVNNNGTLQAESVDIVGGVNTTGLDNIENIDPNGPHPLHASQPHTPDPLINMPTPYVANGVFNIDRGTVDVSSSNYALTDVSDDPNYFDSSTSTVYLKPGIYESIKVTGGIVRFEPGIYVMRPAENTSFAIEVTGGDVVGNGIMFYNTGSNYDATTGAPDNTDYLSNSPPPPPDAPNFGNVKINDSVHFTPLDTSAYNYNGAPASISSFDGMLYYQRRLSDAHIQIEGNSTDNVLTGSWYAKWGEVSIDGQGTYQGSFVVGNLKAEGQATMHIDPDEDALPKALQIFLVE